MHKLGVDEWVILIVKSMSDNAQSKFRVNNSYSKPINVSVGIHQGSVLSPLLFVILLSALFREFSVKCQYGIC